MQVSAPLDHSRLRRLAAATPRWTAAAFALAAIASCDLNPNVEACSVAIAPASITVPVNGAATLIGTAFDCKGTSIKNKTINYQSSNTAIVTVTTTGQVIGVSVGQAVISAVANGKSAEAPVTVIPETAANVTVIPGTVTLRVSNTRQFTAIARNAMGSIVTGRTFRWSSSNSSIAIVDQSGSVIAVAPGNAIIAADADGVIGNSAVTVTPIPIGSCTLSPLSQKVTVTAQVQPTITLRDTADNLVPSQGRPINWTSDNEIVATVTSTGVITARKAGTARITASPAESPSVSCPTTLEAVDARIVTAQIQPRSGSLRIGIPRQLTVTLFDSLGQTIPPGRPVTWSSATPATAHVTATGLVTGTALGNARIAINAEGARDTVAFNVTQIPVASIRVSPLSANLIQGQTVQLTAVVEDSTGTVVTDRPVEWISGEPTKASVTQTGFVQALAPGSVNIAATSENRFATSTINILPVPVDTIVAFPEYSVVQGASSASFAITLKDAAGNQLFSRPVSLTSSIPSVAQGQVNSTATLVIVGAFQPGTTNFTLRALNLNGQPEGKATTVVVTVTAPPPPPTNPPE